MKTIERTLRVLAFGLVFIWVAACNTTATPNGYLVSPDGKHVAYRWTDTSGDPAQINFALASHDLKIRSKVKTDRSIYATNRMFFTADSRYLMVNTGDGFVRVNTESGKTSPLLLSSGLSINDIGTLDGSKLVVIYSGCPETCLGILDSETREITPLGQPYFRALDWVKLDLAKKKLFYISTNGDLVGVDLTTQDQQLVISSYFPKGASLEQILKQEYHLDTVRELVTYTHSVRESGNLSFFGPLLASLSAVRYDGSAPRLLLSTIKLPILSQKFFSNGFFTSALNPYVFATSLGADEKWYMTRVDLRDQSIKSLYAVDLGFAEMYTVNSIAWSDRFQRGIFSQDKYDPSLIDEHGTVLKTFTSGWKTQTVANGAKFLLSWERIHQIVSAETGTREREFFGPVMLTQGSTHLVYVKDSKLIDLDLVNGAETATQTPLDEITNFSADAAQKVLFLAGTKKNKPVYKVVTLR